MKEEFENEIKFEVFNIIINNKKDEKSSTEGE